VDDMTRSSERKNAAPGRRAPRGSAPRLAAIALSLALAGAAHASAPPVGPAGGFGVPAARVREVLRRYPLRTMGGESITLSTLQGEVVVLHFWASWCNPCRRELPRLDRLNAEISKKGGRVVAVAIDEQPESVTRFARAHALRLAIVHDGPGGLARELDLRQLPFTVVLDRNGEVAYTTGRSDDLGLDALAAATRQLVAAPPVAARLHEGDQP
jgi:thiol-disulfide isomerase/thioredoxin